MTILSDYQKYQTEKKLRKDNLQKQYSDNQLRQLEQKNRTQSSIHSRLNRGSIEAQ